MRADALVEGVDGLKAEGRVTNMSYRGCKIETPKPFAIGERIRIEIERLGIIEAEVRWTCIDGAGVRFVDNEFARSNWDR